MSQAEELLNSLVETYVVDYSSDEPHIVINADRTITVPDELKSIAVQYDNNVETVTFDCPRYWDEHDFSTMNIYVNFSRPDKYIGQVKVNNVVVDEEDDSIIHFDWTISNEVTRVDGKLSFLVCIKNLETDIQPHWNSRINQELIIQPGMEMYQPDIEDNPDIIEEMLIRLGYLEAEDVNINIKLSDLDVADSNIRERLDALEQVDTDTDTRLDNLEAADATIRGRLDALEQSDESTATEINNLKGADEAIRGRLDALDQSDENSATEINNLKESDEVIRDRLDNLEQADVNINSEIYALKKADENATTEINNLKGADEAIRGRLDALEQVDVNINTLLNNTSEQLNTHLNNANNPHGVTPEQIGAALAEHDHVVDDVSGLGALAEKSVVEKSDLSSDIQSSLDKADTALQSFTETDPTVPAWAKAETKPTYTPEEIGAVPVTRTINGMPLTGDIVISIPGGSEDPDYSGLGTLAFKNSISESDLDSELQNKINNPASQQTTVQFITWESTD